MVVGDDSCEGGTSRSVTPAGVNGARGSAKCHAPEGRRWAMRIGELEVRSSFVFFCFLGGEHEGEKWGRKETGGTY